MPENTASMSPQQAHQMHKALGEAYEKNRHSIAHITNPKGHDKTLCSVCAEIKAAEKAAREDNLKEHLKCLEMARKEGREEVLEWAIGKIDILRHDPVTMFIRLRQAYKKRFRE